MQFKRASGLITLTTDFGLRDPFVGVMKGSIYRRFPTACIVDLTHEILVHWPAEAGFWLRRCSDYFPEGSVHVAVVDPGVGTARQIIAVLSGGFVFLAPDNGLLAPVVDRDPAAVVHALDTARLAQLGVSAASATFHGRDIFAPVAAEIAAGRCDPRSLGPPVTSIVPSWLEEAQQESDRVTGVVVTIDHFGNLITNIDAPLLRSFVEPHVYAGHQVLPLRRTYADATPGGFLALVNSFGVVEIACAEGSAELALGLSRGAPVVVRDAVRHR
jgi:S-adenosylmethionine hydrolase